MAKTKVKEMAIIASPAYELTDTLSVAKSTLYKKSQLAPYNPDDLVQKFGTSGQGLVGLQSAFDPPSRTH